MAPRLFPRLSWSETTQEAAAQAVMQYEQAHPGIRDRAIQGDYVAQQALMTAIESLSWGPVDFIHEYRRSDVADPALSTDSAKARALVGPQSMQDWVAHHLIPFGVMARQPRDFQLAVAAAGWIMDSVENLIALPGSVASFLAEPNLTRLPYQRGPHSGYDADVEARLAPFVVSIAANATNQIKIRPALLAIETAQRTLIVSQYAAYYERIR